MSQVHLRETEHGWVVESESGGGLAVPRLAPAISLADQWLRATGGHGIVVRRLDGTIEAYGHSDELDR